jgi:hypothetical protein
MKKEIITIEIDHKINDDNGRYGFTMNIDDLINCLQEAKNKGAENISVEATEEYGCAYINLSFTQERMETDNEFAIRVNKENKKQEDIKRRELEQLEKLKSKYGL